MEYSVSEFIRSQLKDRRAVALVMQLDGFLAIS
jgi:hypothetical protein